MPSRAKPKPSWDFRPLAALTLDPRNARTHSDEQVDQIVESIRTFGWTMPIAADEVIRAGNCRYRAAERIYAEPGAIIYMAPGESAGGASIPAGCVPVLDCTGWTEPQRRAYALADNKLALNAGWDEDLLAAELRAIADADFDLGIIGFPESELASLMALAGASAGGGAKLGGLTDEFLIAPFSVLNAREGWWQDRKRAWISLGIQSEVGRGENLLRMSDTMLEPDPAKRAAMQAARAPDTKATHTQDWTQRKIAEGDIAGGMAANQSGTSIFDPVLCELAYRWFSPLGGLVLDPFAGGSVRGIVAAKLERRYIGIDLRAEQVEANEAQAERIFADPAARPEWRCGDSSDELPLDRAEAETELADFIFSCPPYGDLEVYSDDRADLSTMDHEEFVLAYDRIIRRAVDSLKSDRFACFVVGDFRDRKGFYRDFVSTTIRAFETAGAKLYNEAVLITAVGSLPIRAAKQFRSTRKLGKTHQNVLVFCKGDPRKATEACGAVDVSGALTLFEDEGSADDRP